MLLLMPLAACGDDVTTPDAGDTGCADDVECGDGVFCNGTERCEGGSCVAGTAPCEASQTCDEGAGRCVSDCSVEPDADGDGVDALECGGDDCDDANSAVFPGATEVCDAEGVDEDCDPATYGDRDEDADGYVDALCCNGDECGDDCDDEASDVHPTLAETCDDADNDCDGSVDEGVLEMLYPDADGDDFGDASAGATLGCPALLPDLVDNGTDCDDGESRRNPGAPETCDDVFDNDCDSTTAPFDADRDEHDDADCGGVDCNDDDNTINPAVATDACDGVDADCDGFLEDADEDGLLAIGETCTGGPRGAYPRTDCNDTYVYARPGAAEICDGVDTDCDGTIDEAGFDEDRLPDPLPVEAFACTGPTPLPDSQPDRVTYNFSARDTTGSPVPGVPIEFHRSDVISAGETCVEPECTVVTTDSFGDGSVELRPGSWFAYRIPSGGRFLESLRFHQTAEVGSTTIPVSALPSSVVTDPLPGLLLPVDPSQAIVQVRARACDGQPLRNVVLRLYGSGAPLCGYYGYVETNAPLQFSGFDTGDPGQVIVFSVPVVPGDGQVIAELWGRNQGTGMMEVYGREELFVRAGAISTLDIPRLRAGSPDR